MFASMLPKSSVHFFLRYTCFIMYNVLTCDMLQRDFFQHPFQYIYSRMQLSFVYPKKPFLFPSLFFCPTIFPIFLSLPSPPKPTPNQTLSPDPSRPSPQLHHPNDLSRSDTYIDINSERPTPIPNPKTQLPTYLHTLRIQSSNPQPPKPPPNTNPTHPPTRLPTSLPHSPPHIKVQPHSETHHPLYSNFHQRLP